MQVTNKKKPKQKRMPNVVVGSMVVAGLILICTLLAVTLTPERALTVVPS